MTLAPSAPPSSLDRLGETTTLAVSYLRVSTKEQAQRGGRSEGFSIPAQREANLRKARDLNAIVVEEFVDAGESARKADRPELLRMIEYVKTHSVAYCIVHKVDRLARNRADDVTIHLALKDAGVMLVSATENIDETPSGMLLHGIMSTIAEFYSRNLANEVAKGMTQKASTGGTVACAPIGYLNVHKRDELGRDVPTVDLDPDRAALVRWAFEAYATGNYSTITLREELIDRGLTTVPTPKRPAKAPGLSTIQRMLSNPYYKGDVIFRGASYTGLHEPLVTPEMWYRVQNVLTAHQVSGEKTQAHDHYLKGTIYCGDCASRLMITHAKNRHGNVYPYFICAGRHSKRTTCQRQAMPVGDIERLVEDYYRQVQIPEHIVTALRHMLTRQFDDLHAASKTERRTLATEREKLRDERRSLLHAHHAGAVPLDLLKEEQDRISRRLAFLDSRIEAGQIEYDQAKAHLEDCLALAGNAHAIYMSIDDSLRRICNQSFFERINVYEIDDTDTVLADHGEPFDILFDPALHAEALAYEQRQQEGDAQPPHVEGLNIQHWVEHRGFEPLTYGLQSHRSTN
ncbi:Recombinase [Propionibacterium freudenreichii]|nr:Recombinase [Propionibacterium freudenreichii]SBN96586.1 Site-specific recombinases, DNA invertase Pin homologs [Propionibacterium freudenreichii]SCC98171.1 Site-specific recombinases, DNA invertase Pin homologs [Propionibacterium freudenreichii]